MKMVGRKLKYYQVDCSCCSSKESIKRKEEIQWRSDWLDEFTDTDELVEYDCN